MTTTRRTLEAELTPYTLTADEGAAVRTGFDLALRVRYEEAHIAVCDLSEAALRDALLAHTMFGSMLRFELAGREFGRSLKAACEYGGQCQPGDCPGPCGNDSKIWSCPEGCGYHIADGPVPDGEDSTDDLIFQHLEEHRPTVEQVTIAALSPDSLPVRCPRCGHDEDRVHMSQDGRRLCLDCGGFCSPVLVANGNGWTIEGRTAK